MKNIKKEIEKMLRESTGSHFLDSGGAYGRNWQRNQEIKSFDDLPEFTVTGNKWNGKDVEIDITINIYHYLINMLEITEESEKLNRKLQRFMNSNDDPYLTNMEEFAEKLEESGEYGSINLVNTYNFDNNLSQVLQFITIENCSMETFIILSIHQGCDVRGGYTKPKIFAVPELDYFYLYMNDCSAYEIYPEKDKNQLELSAFDNVPELPENRWYSDDGGYHFYNDNSDTDLNDVLDYNEETEKFFNHKSGNEIEFYVNLQY